MFFIMKKIFTFSFALMLSVLTVFAQSEWCSKQIWHDLPYGSTPKENANQESLALLSVVDNGDGTITFTVSADPENPSHSDIDYILINPLGLTAGTDVDSPEESQSSLSATYTVPEGVTSLENLEILWSYAGWGGRWMVNQFSIDLADICTGGEQPAEDVISETTMFNMADVAAAEYTANFTIGGKLEVAATSGKKVVVETSGGKTYDELEIPNRLKLGGTGAADYRNIKAKVSGPCTVYVYALSGTGGATRTLDVDLNEFGTHVAQLSVTNDPESETRKVNKVSYEYTGSDPATLYFYSDNSGLNLYAIEFVFASAPACQPEITACEVSEITSTSVKLAFSGNECIRGGDVYNGETLLASITGPEIVIPGLTPETTYNLTAIAYNEDGDPSPVYNVPEFTTLAEGALGDNLALNKPIVAGFEATPAREANDGNYGTRWGSSGAQHYATAGEDAQDWIYVDLGAVYDINLIRVYYENAAPSDYDILVSNNGTTWTVAGTYNEMAAGSVDGSVATDYNLTTQGRYVKIFARNGLAGLEWGISIWELEVYGTAAILDDTTKPVMGTASLVEAGMDYAIVAVDGATDDDPAGVVGYQVEYNMDGTNHTMVLAPDAEDHLLVTGLTGGRHYKLHVYAIDAAGNISDNDAIVELDTSADTTRPYTAPADPTFAAEDVINIFSDAYAAPNPAWSFGNGWYHGAQFSIVGIDGNQIMLYQSAPADGLTGAQVAEFDASGMTHVYFDIWGQSDGTVEFKLVTIGESGNIDLNSRPLSIVAGQWTNYDLVIADEFPTANLARTFQFGLQRPTVPNFAMDNILLHKVNGQGTALEMIQQTGIRYFNGMLYNQNNVRMEVFNVQGKKVADTTADFDMNYMPNGLYMVRANNAVLKFVK